MTRRRTFIYFLPGVTEKPSAEQLARTGLDAVLGAAPLAYTPISQARGPSGGPGMLLALAGKRSPLYKPDRQEWRDFGKFHLGWWTDAAPRPEDLERGELLDGHSVKLGDGHEWIVPCARMLPEAMTYTPDQGWGTERMAWHAWLWDIADQFWAEFTASVQASAAPEGEGVMLTLSGAADFALRVLGANYRIGAAEVSALKLFTSNTPVEVLLALCDWPRLREQLGKLAGTAEPDAG